MTHHDFIAGDSAFHLQALIHHKCRPSFLTALMLHCASLGSIMSPLQRLYGDDGFSPLLDAADTIGGGRVEAAMLPCAVVRERRASSSERAVHAVVQQLRPFRLPQRRLFAPPQLVLLLQLLPLHTAAAHLDARVACQAPVSEVVFVFIVLVLLHFLLFFLLLFAQHGHRTRGEERQPC